MSEPLAKARPSIDLDDFERRLHSDHHQTDHHGDPLAELARLVGETPDPYGDVFAQEAQPGHAHQVDPYYGYDSARREPQFDPYAGAQHGGVSPRLSGDFAAIEAGLRGALATQSAADLHDSAQSHEFYAQHDQYSQDEQAYLQDHEAQQWADEAQQRAVASAPRSRRPVYAMAATIAIGVIGVGVAFAYKGSSSSPSEIRMITAAAGPTKIQPPADADKDRGTQDAAILGKTNQPAPTQLVNREEQPVDISQAVQQNASRDPDAGPAPGDAANVPLPPAQGQSAEAPQAAPPPVDQAPSFGMSGMPAPKKVKVVSVRPDGSILSNDAPPAAAMPAPTVMPSLTSQASDSPPVAKPSTPKSTATPKTTSRVAAKPVRMAKVDTAKADTDDDAPATDTPAPKPAHKAKPQKVATAAPAGDDIAPTASVPTRDAGGAGGFAVQLAAPGSEADARAATSRLGKKFAAALDGRRLGFHKAQSNGKSVFRVRVSSLSREEATSLCEKLKADGGSCFVAKKD